MATAPLTVPALRDAIAEALAVHVKAYDLAEVCVQLGIIEEPFDQLSMNSKRVTVRSFLQGADLPWLITIARKVVYQFDDQDLATILPPDGFTAVSGELKNLIFAANGPKPKIILRDAINNILEIVENEQYCLVYDRPLNTNGLSWRELVAWWVETQDLPQKDEREQALSLGDRLYASLQGNGAEELVFRTYAEQYRAPGSFELPAIIPQVYLHYDPYTRKSYGSKPGPLQRQRMDFLILMPNQARIVIEVDGRGHYASDDGAADPERYASMMAEDRTLRLMGYEVYRFGVSELAKPEAKSMLSEFFAALLERHNAT
jgi:very-short-patch-repair endonuclease